MTVKTHGRQWPLVAEQPFDFTDLTVAPSALELDLPVGAVVIRAGVFIETAFDAGSAIAVGITGTTDLYVAAADLAVVGFVNFTTGLGIKALGETVIITPDTEALASAAGVARFIFEYVIDGRANEVQP